MQHMDWAIVQAMGTIGIVYFAQNTNFFAA